MLFTDEMIAMITNEIGALREIPDQDPRAPATEYEFEDGKGPHRVHCVRQPTLLFELQSHSPHGGWQVPLLPVCD